MTSGSSSFSNGVNWKVMAQRAKKWQAELQESIASAATDGDEALTKVLNTYKPAFVSLARSLEQGAVRLQGDFFDAESTQVQIASSSTSPDAIDQTIEHVLRNVSNVALPNVQTKQKIHARRGN